MRAPLAYLCVALGGAVGSVGRYWLAEFIGARWPGPLPWGTLVVNITGSLAIGLLAASLPAEGPWWRLLLMVGVCGGYTTFSAFSLQTLTLLRNGAVTPALGYTALSVSLCLAATWLGMLLGEAIQR